MLGTDFNKRVTGRGIVKSLKKINEPSFNIDTYEAEFGKEIVRVAIVRSSSQLPKRTLNMHCFAFEIIRIIYTTSFDLIQHMSSQDYHCITIGRKCKDKCTYTNCDNRKDHNKRLVIINELNAK